MCSRCTDLDLAPASLGPAWTAMGRAPLPFETSVPAVFAAGDARAGSVKHVASAAGEGASTWPPAPGAREASTQINMNSHLVDPQAAWWAGFPDGGMRWSKHASGRRRLAYVAVALLTRAEAQGHSIRRR